MTATNLPKYNINDVCNGLGITDSTLRRWRRELENEQGITLERIKEDGITYYTDRAFQILSSYQAYKHGDHEFILPREVEVLIDEAVEQMTATNQDETVSATGVREILTTSIKLAIAFIQVERNKFKLPTPPLENHKNLADCVEKGFLLTSSQVKQITGKYPQRRKKDEAGKYYRWRNFKFYLVRKEDDQYVWRVVND